MKWLQQAMLKGKLTNRLWKNLNLASDFLPLKLQEAVLEAVYQLHFQDQITKIEIQVKLLHLKMNYRIY